MIYKFGATVPVADTSSLITPDGSIEVSAQINIVLPVSVNTELPDDKVVELTNNASAYLSTLLNSSISVELISKE